MVWLYVAWHCVVCQLWCLIFTVERLFFLHHNAIVIQLLISNFEALPTASVFVLMREWFFNRWIKMRTPKVFSKHRFMDENRQQTNKTHMPKLKTYSEICIYLTLSFVGFRLTITYLESRPCDPFHLSSRCIHTFMHALSFAHHGNYQRWQLTIRTGN